MDKNMVGLLLSYVFVFAVIAIATVCIKLKLVSSASARKIIHIGVSNWWILATVCFDRLTYPVIGAGSFIIINYLSYRLHLFRAMEDAVKEKNLGTVYFPISLLVLSILCFGGWMPLYAGGIGILVLGYGDGMASLIGMKWGKHPVPYLRNGKSIEGSCAMFIASFIVTCIMIQVYAAGIPMIQAALLVAATATILEAVTPYGMDNLTVPIISTLVYYLAYL